MRVKARCGVGERDGWWHVTWLQCGEIMPTSRRHADLRGLGGQWATGGMRAHVRVFVPVGTGNMRL